MNTFGRSFIVNIFGESHGQSVGVIVDGCPSGLSLSEDDLIPDLMRRKSGAKGTTTRTETDTPRIRSGLVNGQTTGAPILVLFENENTDADPYKSIRWTPRPGHADFVAHEKFGGFNDYRGGGHFSGRLTVGLVAAGAIARKLLRPVRIEAMLIEAGGSGDIEKAVDRAMKDGDSIGGIVSCTVTGLPVGLGEPFFDSVESLISHAAFSVPAVKAIEFGVGFACAAMRGSDYNDEILDLKGTTRTNNAGGINGGITNSNDLVFRVAVRPTASISTPQATVDLRSGDRARITVAGRHDACIALRIPVIIEAVTAIVLADLMILNQSIKRVLL